MLEFLLERIKAVASQVTVFREMRRTEFGTSTLNNGIYLHSFKLRISAARGRAGAHGENQQRCAWAAALKTAHLSSLRSGSVICFAQRAKRDSRFPEGDR